MAIINCSKCDHKVSNKADRCPECGAPIYNSKLPYKRKIQEIRREYWLRTLTIILLVLAFVIWHKDWFISVLKSF